MTATTQAPAASEYVCTAPSGCHEYILPPLFELCSQIGPNTRVLDVGCGNGSVAAEIAKRGCKIVGIDMSETGASLAGQNCPTGRFEVFPADENLLRNLGEEPFDFVYSLEVIERSSSTSTIHKVLLPAALAPRGMGAGLSVPRHIMGTPRTC